MRKGLPRLLLPVVMLLLMAASCNPQTTQLTVVITTPTTDVTIDTTLTIDVTVTGGIPDEVALLLDNTVLAVLTAPYSYTWDAGSMSNGTYTLTARATLGGRTFTSDPRTVTVEHPQPTLQVSITSPNADAYTNGTLGVQVNVTGGTPDAVALLLDGSPFATLVPPYSFSWDTTSLTEGTYELTAQATLGSQAFTSEARMVTVDRTSPTVTSRTPVPGTSNVWLGEMITAVFSEDVLASTVNDSSVILTGQGNVNLGKTVSVTGDTLTVRLTGAPTLPNTLTVTLTTAITDLAGNALMVPPDAWSWDLPDWLALGDALSAELGNTSASRPSLVVDSSGTLTVAWDEFDGTARNIYVQQWNGSSWVPLGGALSAEPGNTFALAPSLVVDSSGTLTVAWYEFDGTAENIYVRQWNGSSWVPLGGALSAEPGNTAAASPSLVVDSSGTLTVAWYEWDGTTENIYVRQWNGSSWVPLGGALSAEPGNTNASRPSLVVDSSGTLTVAWDEFDGTTFNIYVRQWNGSSWVPLGGTLSVEPGTTSASWPSLVVDSSGTLTVAWQESDGTVNNIYVQQWTGSSWVPLGGALSAEPGTTSASNPSLVVDSSGTLTVAWLESDGTAVSIFVRRLNTLP